MKITLNGYTKELAETPNLKMFIERFCNTRTPVVAELNGEIIKDPLWEQTLLRDGDILELIGFVGGGSFVASCSLACRQTGQGG